MRNPFNTVTLALMPLAIVINLTIGSLIVSAGAAGIIIPLYLDSIGTVLVGVIAGPLAGAVTGLISNLVWAFLPIPGAQYVAWFAPVAAVVGLFAGLFGGRGWLRRLGLTIAAGLLTGLVAALISAPIAAYVFGGVTGGPTDILVGAYQQLTTNLQTAVFLQSGTSDLPDKLVTYIIIFLILRGLPRRLLVRFPQGEKSTTPRRQPLVGRVE